MNRYISPMLVVAVAIGVYFYSIDKTYKNIAQQLAQEQVIEGFILDANDAKNLLDKVISEHRSFPPDADYRLSVLLPETVNAERMIIDVDAIAQKHGLSIGSPIVTIAVFDSLNPNAILEHELRFKLISTYPTFRKFLYDVESSLAIRNFSEVAFTSAVSFDDTAPGIALNPEFQVLIYNVVLKTYSLR